MASKSNCKEERLEGGEGLKRPKYGFRWTDFVNDCKVEDANTGDSGSLTMTVSGDTGDQGGTMGEAFDILPPFYAIAYIMRVS